MNTTDIIEKILRDGTNATELTKIISEAQRKINEEQKAEKEREKLVKARTNFIDSMTEYFSILTNEKPSQENLTFVKNELIKIEKDVSKFNKSLFSNASFPTTPTKSDNELIQEFLSKYCC